MLKQLKSKREQGFTIIEVMIVLAIAGVIMLVVFLAVPALQRNNRNVQLKNAAAAILGAINEFETNNNGQLPTTVAIAADGTINVTSTVAGTTPATGRTQGGYTASVQAAKAAGAATGDFAVILNFKCSGTAPTVAATRAASVSYTIETATTTALQCADS
jgi:prepilin-type N-terminal cleavage/methylation domain-containing protein